MSSCVALWMHDPGSFNELGHGSPDEAADEVLHLEDLLVELEPGGVRGCPAQRASRAGRKLAAADGELEQVLDWHLVAQVLVRADEQRLDLVARRGVALTALLRAVVNARNASTAPPWFRGTVVACPASTARAAAWASTGSLALRRRFARRGRLTSTTVRPAACRVRVSW